MQFKNLQEEIRFKFYSDVKNRKSLMSLSAEEIRYYSSFYPSIVIKEGKVKKIRVLTPKQQWKKYLKYGG